MRLRLFSLAFLLISSFAIAKDKKPDKSRTPLSPDEISIYQEFLRGYNNGSGANLNISQVTSPFAQDRFGAEEACLRPLNLADVDQKSSTVHVLQPDQWQGFHLVDPEDQSKRVTENDPGRQIRNGESVKSAVQKGFSNGLLTLSEIAFNKDHTKAAMTFSFWCGMLCGHGETLIFEKKDGRWEKSKDSRCGSWIS